MNSEIWKAIDGYEGIYEISDHGRVRSIPRVGTKGGIIMPRKRNGYYAVDLCRDGKKATRDVHRLVAIAFIDNDDELPLINHRDENRLNNMADNLEWCTAQYNVTYGNGIKKMLETRKRNKALQIKSTSLEDHHNGGFLMQF